MGNNGGNRKKMDHKRLLSSYKLHFSMFTEEIFNLNGGGGAKIEVGNIIYLSPKKNLLLAPTYCHHLRSLAISADTRSFRSCRSVCPTPRIWYLQRPKSILSNVQVNYSRSIPNV